MTKLSSSNLVDQIKEAGINFLPADQIYYKKFPYKVELSPVFKGLGPARKAACRIDISDPEKARARLEEFVNTTTNKILNAEKRLDIIAWVDRLPNVEYKRRMGGENSLFYFRNADLVMALCKEFTSLINSVTGPISATHEAALDDTRNIIMREKLYYDRFRYHVTFTDGRDFFEDCGHKLIEWLDGIEKTRWKAHRLHLMRDHYAYHDANPGLAQPLISQSPFNFTSVRTRNWPPSRPITLFLTQPEDFVYVKLITSGFIIQSHEIALFDELT